jgi:hypothetical protein
MNQNICINDQDGKVIGKFIFDTLPCTFEGDVDASAKVFVDVVCGFITTRLTQAYNEGLEDAAKIAESFKFNGDYKDCPAAWITVCYDKFAKAIRTKLTKEEV